MNRGRRRGGGPSLSGLRDGVKRRLLIPTLSRRNLILSSNADNNSDVTNTEFGSLQMNLFEVTAKLETAFRLGPFYHPVPELSEGINISLLTSSNNLKVGNKTPNMVSLLHLLVAHDEVNQWSDEDMNMKEPDDWTIEYKTITYRNTDILKDSSTSTPKIQVIRLSS
ncbi:unnamed protein product [Heterobilharzia americana]|nr:unnamed protein product [Heterobilharzia americana]